ncbi:hypothetical protein GRX01_10905 [Halobaculum sp. WSA2]|uniref:Uncharacterized protein n=1 Tax=Halobaculum saliterrae TaxID=2073113 RepID=A0A6B0SZR4_9EURY|nr:hypothetical protein [Halobaculum saliterrae]MXR41842.1 hypothetical protein [Halobaculum saliterrae]
MSQEDTTSRLRTRVRGIVERSAVGSAVADLGNAARSSSLTAFARRVGEFTRHSFFYRWLTKEPEPEVIVIDLRETWTVGPIIALLDWAIERTLPYWRGSTLKQALDRLVALGERAADTRAGQLLVRVLEPPEPPDRHADRSSRGSGNEEPSENTDHEDESGQEPPDKSRDSEADR